MKYRPIRGLNSGWQMFQPYFQKGPLVYRLPLYRSFRAALHAAWNSLFARLPNQIEMHMAVWKVYSLASDHPTSPPVPPDFVMGRRTLEISRLLYGPQPETKPIHGVTILPGGDKFVDWDSPMFKECGWSDELVAEVRSVMRK